MQSPHAGNHGSLLNRMGACVVVAVFLAIASFSIFRDNRAAASSLLDDAPPPGSLAAVSSDVYLDQESGFWVSPGTETSGAAIQRIPSGGPDTYGYSFTEAPLSWIDATAGTDTGLSGSSSGKKVGPIALPFSFKYYENTYTSVYIAASGYLAFTDSGSWISQSIIPSPTSPNNVVAPYWAPLTLNTEGPTARVYYTAGGVAPNRYLVVEWYQVKDYGFFRTFEVLLYENGDIVFQYLPTTGGGGTRTCGSAGIEDSTGEIGLAPLVGGCDLPPNSGAYRFTRPAPRPRVYVQPEFQGQFVSPGDVVTSHSYLRNTGEAGVDTFDVLVSSSWPALMYGPDGSTPLADTDGDGIPDSGPLPAGSTLTLTLAVSVPLTLAVEESDQVVVTATSSLSPTLNKGSVLQLASPAPFAQVYKDAADSSVTLYLAQPGFQVEKQVPAPAFSSSPAVVETAGGNFLYAWTRARTSSSGKSIREVVYALLDRYGNALRSVSPLADLGNATTSTYDNAPALAATPDGHLGVLWYRYDYDSALGYRYNVFLAILDQAGDIVVTATNLTGNELWWKSGAADRMTYQYPRLAATGDNRFFMVWMQTTQTSATERHEAQYAVRDTSGSETKAVSAIVSEAQTNGWSYPQVNLAALSGNRVFLALATYQNRYGGPGFAVLDSAGGVVQAPSFITVGVPIGWVQNPDVVHLANGNTLLAWEVMLDLGRTYDIRFAILDPSFNVIAGPVVLAHPAASTGSAYVSVSADTASRAILTWTDQAYNLRRNLYYALVDGAGSIVTPPMIFMSGRAVPASITTSLDGYGNTSYAWSPPAGVDLAVGFARATFGGPSGQSASIAVSYTNHAMTTATAVVLTLTVGSDLQYISDTSGVTPTVSGDTVIWVLPDVRLMAEVGFSVRLGLPEAPALSHYRTSVQISSDAPDVDPSDNTATADVVVQERTYLSVIVKAY
jgi:hypothetical protein